MAESQYKVSYCRRWNFRRHTPIDSLAPQAVVEHDARREVYSVILHDPSGGKVPEAVIEIDWANDFAGVWFFDAFGRRSLNYVFRRNGDQLFLFNMIAYSYPDDERSTLSGANHTEEFTFQENGVARLVVMDDNAQEKATEDRSGIDVASHWEPVPRFGAWDSLARWNREVGEDDEDREPACGYGTGRKPLDKPTPSGRLPRADVHRLGGWRELAL